MIHPSRVLIYFGFFNVSGKDTDYLLAASCSLGELKSPYREHSDWGQLTLGHKLVLVHISTSQGSFIHYSEIFGMFR